jgi:hypothetical protein
MGRREWRGGVVWAVFLLVTGCARGPQQSASSSADTTIAGAPSTPATAPTAAQENGVLAASVGGVGDAAQIASLVGATITGGERFVVGFARADGLPAARLGPARVEFLRELRVIRIHLPASIGSTALTDNAFTTFLSDRAYVVRPLGGDSLWIDLHLRSSALARAEVRSDPALVVVELQPGGPSFGDASGLGPNVVVLTPRPGRARYPLEVTGYARTFEGNVVAELRENGRAVAKTHTTAADWVSAWGEFRMRLDTGPRGPVELFVGEYSAENGTERGATVRIGIE